MVLTRRLVAFGFACPRPLLVVAPAATAQRLAVERALRLRGGEAAVSAADADTLLVCGAPPAELEAVADRLWTQIPSPRVRVAVPAAADADAALDEAVRGLADLETQTAASQLRDAGVRAREESGTEEDESGSDGDGEGEEQDDDDMMPAGLPMAGTAPDRDGLNLDQLHVQLGPVLPDWPAGLIVRLAVQGDVIQEAEVDTSLAQGCDGGSVAFWDRMAADGGDDADEGQVAARTAAAHLDSVGRLLGVAGWSAAATRARRLRDDLLDGSADVAGVKRFGRRIRRAAVLRWLLSDIGLLDHQAALEHGVRGPALRAAGDAHARLRQWLLEAEAALEGEPVPGEGPRGRTGQPPASAALAEVLPDLLRGLDIGGARLVVASLDPDLDQLASARMAVPGAR